MNIKTFLLRLAQFVGLTLLFAVIYAASAAPLGPYLPPISAAEPGLLPSPLDVLVVCAVHVLVIMAILLASRWTGWKLALATGVAYYGVTTFMAQIETWYFLSDLTITPGVLSRLFLMGVPTAFLFIPIAVLVLGKARGRGEAAPAEVPRIPAAQWAWKLALIALAYLLLYFSAGYFIAWQNPELRAFYGGPEHASFFAALAANWQNDPLLFPFQVGRSLLWTLFALPVVRMTRGGPWRKALYTALLLGVPMNIGHILANPLIPAASVRFSHMIETASSTFVFGLLIAWLLHRRHDSLADLLGIQPARQVPHTSHPTTP